MGLADNGLKTAIVNLRIEMENKIFLNETSRVEKNIIFK